MAKVERRNAFMKHPVVERTTDQRIDDFRHKIAPRRVACIGGTTTLVDCLVALRYLANPRQLIQGPAIAKYERAFAQQIGVRHAYSFCHGRVGFYGLLHGLGIGSGDEVLLQVPTNIVVSNAIRYTGAKPVYVDCRLDTYTMDIEQAERRITTKTKALVLQHTFGIPADLDAALDLARRYGLDIIEDCVHSLGATYDGRQVGSFGRAAFFSSEHSKIISTMMGGMAVTDDPELAARLKVFQQSCAYPSAWQVARYMLKLLVYHLVTKPHLYYYTWSLYEFFGRRNPLPHPTTPDEVRGGRPANYEQRLSNAQAALGLSQLRQLTTNLAHRRAIASAYSERLSKEGFNVPHPPTKAEPSFVRYPVWVEDPTLAVLIAARHATLGKWFTSVLEEAPSPDCGDYEMGSCSQAEEATRHLLNLPTQPLVRAQDVEKIVSAVVRAETMAKGRVHTETSYEHSVKVRNDS
jgi:perosamine synthetase